MQIKVTSKCSVCGVPVHTCVHSITGMRVAPHVKSGWHREHFEAKKTITRAKGKTAEQQIDIESVQIPDLWHIAQLLREVAEAAGVIFDFEAERHIKYPSETRILQTVKVEMTLAGTAQSADKILDCWHLCHDLRNHIINNG